MSDSDKDEKKAGLLSRLGRSATEKGKSVVGYDTIKQGWSDIAEGVKILNPFRKSERKKRRPRTFQQVYERNKLDEEILAKIYRNMLWGFAASVFFALVCIVMALYLGNTRGMFAGLSAIGPMAVCFSLAASSAFKMAQIRRRDLNFSFGDWRRSPSEWLPRPFARHRGESG